MARNLKYQKQYERYDWLKKKGFCVNCGKQEACYNSIYCPDCWEKSTERNRKYHEEHHEEHKRRCSEYNKKRYSELKENGICTKCAKHKAVEGQSLCLSCKAKAHMRKDPRWNNDMERSHRPDYGLCYVCAAPLGEYKSLCDECHRRASEKMSQLNSNPTEAMIAAREEYMKCYKRFKDSIFAKKKGG